MAKPTIRRRLTRKRKVNRKNKKTHRKGKKQSGGRRRPDGPGTGGALGNNGAMNEGGPDYLSEEEKEEAIGLIQRNEIGPLLTLLGTRTFPDDDTLIVAVTTPGVHMEMISEVIFRTYIDDNTETQISRAIGHNFPYQRQVMEELRMQKQRQQEQAALAQQEQKQANNNGRPSTPLPPMRNYY